MDCVHIPEIESAEWGQLIRDRLHGQRYPMSGILELTERCNFNCVHCYINQPAGHLQARNRELSTSQVKQVFDEIAEAGCLFLTITGGEPMLRPDFAEIYSYAKQLGLLINIFTNGSMITSEIADLFKELPPSGVDITLYGFSPETYEEVTGTLGSLARVQQGIQLLISRSIPFSLKTMVLTINQHELSEMRHFAEELGVKFRYDSTLWPRLDGSFKPFEYQIPLEDKIALEFSDDEAKEEWVDLYNKNRGKMTRAKFEYSCNASVWSFFITSAGELCMCIAARKPAFNILKDGFQKCWEELGEVRLIKRKQDTPCQTCTLNDLCDLCPGWSQAMHGDNETPVSHLCELAHRRAIEIGVESGDQMLMIENKILENKTNE